MSAHPIAAFLGGVVAAEATFASGRALRFAVTLGARDLETCELFRDFLGCGTIYRYPRRKPSYDDEVVFQVRRIRDLVEVVVPFLDEHLGDSYKREQYLAWREHLARRIADAPPTTGAEG